MERIIEDKIEKKIETFLLLKTLLKTNIIDKYLLITSLCVQSKGQGMVLTAWYEKTEKIVDKYSKISKLSKLPLRALLFRQAKLLLS